MSEFIKRFGTLTVGEARALNKAARQTCGSETISQTESD